MWYRVKTGMFAWIIFRITGLALVVYLFLHIHVISSLQDPAKFDQTMSFLGSPVFRFFEIGLLAAIIVHAMNGIRIFIVDFSKGALMQAKLFWVLFVLGLVLFIAGSYPLISHASPAQYDHQNKSPSVEIISSTDECLFLNQPEELHYD